MICPKCHHKFKYSEVSLEDRYIQAGATVFHCINCRALLSPTKEYKILMNTGIITICIIGPLLSLLLFNSFSYFSLVILLSCIIVGTSLSIYAHRSLNLIEIAEKPIN